MTAIADTSSLEVPPALLAEIRAAADAAHQPADDVLRDVIERGLEERRWRGLLTYGAERAKRMGLTEADVPRMIEEVRGDQRQSPE